MRRRRCEERRRSRWLSRGARHIPSRRPLHSWKICIRPTHIASCLQLYKGYLRPMASESGKQSKSRAARSSRRRGSAGGLRIEYETLAAEAGSRFRPKREIAAADGRQNDVPMGPTKRSSKRTNVTFGSVTIKGVAPPIEDIERNIASGNSALGRAARAFAKPGIRLSRRKNIPFYRADPTESGVLIRELNGRSERVILVDGEFKLVE
jgi:hypothetical protein